MIIWQCNYADPIMMSLSPHVNVYDPWWFFWGGILRALRCSPGNPISLTGLRLWQDPVTSGSPGTVCECVAYPIFGQNFAMRMCIFPCITTNVLFGLLLDVIINTLLSVLTRNHESHDHMTLQLCRHHNDLNISCNWQFISIKNICICDIMVYQLFIYTLPELWFLMCYRNSCLIAIFGVYH